MSMQNCRFDADLLILGFFLPLSESELGGNGAMEEEEEGGGGEMWLVRWWPAEEARDQDPMHGNQGSPNRREPVRFDRFPTKPPRTGSGSGRPMKAQRRPNPNPPVPQQPALILLPPPAQPLLLQANFRRRPPRSSSRRIFAAGRRNRRASRLTAPGIPPVRLRGNGRLTGSRPHTPAYRSVAAVSRPAAAVSRPTEVVHCEKVSKEVREYFQRELERAKKVTAQRAQEKLRKEKAAAEGNYPGGDEAYDEEAELKRALNQSRAEEEFRRGVQQRGGAYEYGGGSGTRGEGGTLQRMLRRATSSRQTPGVTDYNLGSARGSTQPRIDTGSWTQKDEDDDEGDTPLLSNIVADKINPADLRNTHVGKRKYHIAPSKVNPKRQRGQATGKGKQKEVEVLSDEETDDAVAVLLAVAGTEACHLQTHLLDIDHGAPMSQRRTVGPTDYDSPQFSSSSSYRESSHVFSNQPAG
nr:unnamed protein product [Digitaria exilis]